jgi:uncharacterized membrane protein
MCLSKDCALKAIAVLAVAGILFSGYLSYQELFAASCGAGCPAPSTLPLGLPACVYGFAMYAIVLCLALTGLYYNPKKGRK